MKDLFAYLEQNGIKNAGDVASVVSRLSITKLIELTHKTRELSDFLPITKTSSSPFNFSVNTSMSGIDYCCSFMDCRLRRVGEISAFATMYADKVLVRNFLKVVSEKTKIKDEKEGNWLREAIIGDYTVLLKFAPLLKEGIIEFSDEKSGFCPDCAKLEANRIVSGLGGLLKDKFTFYLENERMVTLKQEEKYIDITAKFSKKPFTKFGTYSKFPHVFSLAEVKQFGLFDEFFGPIVLDVLSQRQNLLETNLSYLTNRKIDSKIIELMGVNKKSEMNKSNMLEAISHSIPFIQGVPISKLIELRQKDGSAFATYRDAFRQLLKEVVDVNDPKQVQKAVADIVAPEVNKIQRLIDVHRANLQGKLKKDIVFNSVVIGAGFFAAAAMNLDPALTVGTLLGSSSIGAVSGHNLIDDLLQSNSVPKEAKTNSYFFLWEINKN